MVLEFGLLKSDLFPSSDAAGEGLTPDIPEAIRNESGDYCLIKTGNFTGDGSRSQAIVGIGFTPIEVRIWLRGLSNADAQIIFVKSEVDQVTKCVRILAGNISCRTTKILSLDSDGFTVDDSGTNIAPNKNAEAYNFQVLGIKSVV